MDAIATTAGLVSVTAGTGVDTITVDHGTTTITSTTTIGGADEYIMHADYDASAAQLTIATGYNTDNISLDFTAFQSDGAGDWGSEETSKAAVTADDSWYYASGVLTVYNDALTIEAAEDILITNAHDVIDGLNGHLTIDVAS